MSEITDREAAICEKDHRRLLSVSELADIRRRENRDGSPYSDRDMLLDHVVLVEAELAAAREREQKRPEGREGIVTVYDHEDNYLGCMGIETWRAALAADGKVK